MAWTQFELSRSWPWDKDSCINIWHLLRKCSREKQVSKWRKQDWKGGTRQAREKLPVISESQIPQGTLDHKLHLRFVPLWGKEWSVKLPHKSVLGYRFSQECSAFQELLLLCTKNKGRRGSNSSRSVLGERIQEIWMIPRDVCYMWRQPYSAISLHLSWEMWFSMFCWAKAFNCEVEFTSPGMHLEPGHFHRNCR